MKKYYPCLPAGRPLNKVKDFATAQSLRLGEKAIATTENAKNFIEELATFFIFISRIGKETFSRAFEFKEFLRQCFQIGYKSLPLISITGTIMGCLLYT